MDRAQGNYSIGNAKTAAKIIKDIMNFLLKENPIMTDIDISKSIKAEPKSGCKSIKTNGIRNKLKPITYLTKTEAE